MLRPCEPAPYGLSSSTLAAVQFIECPWQCVGGEIDLLWQLLGVHKRGDIWIDSGTTLGIK